uniref:translation initiation factor IF-2-like n=1 Tax=Callithrix jacchus TaxID=9483 RepID=UPI0023DD16D2|nr:translation initiation factor IF-2-like [Callithrix jacchus]
MQHIGEAHSRSPSPAHGFPLYSPGSPTQTQSICFAYFHLTALPATGCSPFSPLRFGSQEPKCRSLQSHQPKRREDRQAPAPPARSPGSSKWQARLCPAPRRPPEPGGSFSTTDRGVRAAPVSPAPARGSRGRPPCARGRSRCAERGLGAGGGREGSGGGAAFSPPASPIYLLRQGHGPTASPLPGGLDAGGVSWRRAEQQGRAASSHSRRMRIPRRPGSHRSGDRHPRLAWPRCRRCTGGSGSRHSRQLPWAASPARSLLRFFSRGLGPAERARESRCPARARDCEEGGGTVTWDRGVRRCRLGWARLGRRHAARASPASPPSRPAGGCSPAPGVARASAHPARPRVCTCAGGLERPEFNAQYNADLYAVNKKKRKNGALFCFVSFFKNHVHM